MHMKRAFGAGGLAAVVAAIVLAAGAASASTTPGEWYSYPPQTFTTSVTNTTGFSYKVAVRPPIRAGGTSTWPVKRGVIPVQFDLLAAPTQTTTTTKTYDPPVWQSLNADGSVSYAGLCLVPTSTGCAPSALTFNDITNLSATYAFTTGDCFGGSLRWDIRIIHDSKPQTVEVYYGAPNGPDQGCSTMNNGSGQNLITSAILPANRFEMLGDFAGVGGPEYTTYAATQAVVGDDPVTSVQLTLDSGWKADQRADVSNVTVNDNTWVPKTVETTTTTTPTGPYAKTCARPPAELRWAKTGANPPGPVNQGQSIQPKDSGQYYRQVDCKYIYNLDVTSLAGKGTYQVYARIGGVNLDDPAVFGLK